MTTHSRPGAEGERGHPLNYYHLNHAEFVTMPETAFALVSLESFRQEKKFRINRNEFVKDLVESGRIKEPEVFLRRRIAWAIEKSYLYASEDGSFIWPHERIDCEREYLKLLARQVT
jgi:hypothetical protein